MVELKAENFPLNCIREEVLWGQNSDSKILTVKTKPELKIETVSLKYFYWKKLYWH